MTRNGETAAFRATVSAGAPVAVSVLRRLWLLRSFFSYLFAAAARAFSLAVGEQDVRVVVRPVAGRGSVEMAGERMLVDGDEDVRIRGGSRPMTDPDFLVASALSRRDDADCKKAAGYENSRPPQYMPHVDSPLERERVLSLSLEAADFAIARAREIS